MFLNEDKKLRLNINVGHITAEFESNDLKSFIPDINAFASKINLEQKRNFSDMELRMTAPSFYTLGNIESAQVFQSSRQLLGDNKTLMNFDSHFVLSYPQFFTVTFTYNPLDIGKYKIVETINRIENSFNFPKTLAVISPDKKNNENEPSLQKSIDWLVTKLNKYITVYHYPNSSFNDYGHYNNISVKNGKLVIPYITEIGWLMEYEIPLNKINFCEWKTVDESNCIFVIKTKGKDIKISQSDGSKKWSYEKSIYYDCSGNENLGERMTKAINYIKERLPNTDDNMANEPF